MAEAAVMSDVLPGKFQQYAQALYNMMLGNTPQISFNEQSASSLKSQLAAALRPAYEQAKLSRQQQTRQNQSQVDADAAARGMGRSTWVTDAKNRLKTGEAGDIAAINSNYTSALYQGLMSKMADQEAKRLQIEQHNNSAKQNAYNNALSTAQSMYQTFLAAEGGGGTGRSSGGPYTGQTGPTGPTGPNDLTDTSFGVTPITAGAVGGKAAASTKKKIGAVGAKAGSVILPTFDKWK